MSKKSTVELKDQLGKLQEERNGIIANIQKENRKANENEEKRLAQIAAEVANTEFEIKLAEERNKHTFRPAEGKNVGNMLIRSIREMVQGRYTSETEEMRRAGEECMKRSGIATTSDLIIPMEFRGNEIKATVATDGKEIVTEEMMDILSPIRDKLVLVQAGANYLTGLVGNIGLPSYSGSNAEWAEESGEATNGKGSFAKKQLSPKRLTAYLDVTKQFLAQDSVGANAMLMSDLTTAVAVKLQSTIFGKHVHADTMPDGFFTGSPTYSMSGSATYSGIVKMETDAELDSAMYDNISYIMHPGARGVLKTTLRAASVAEGFIYDNNMVNGYKTFVTSGMSKGLQSGQDEFGIVFGNWYDLIIGQWGGLELTVDPYTQASKGMIRLVINSYFDAISRRDNSFAIGSLK